MVQLNGCSSEGYEVSERFEEHINERETIEWEGRPRLAVGTE